MSAIYRGRLAPSPTGFLHLGHARTFWMAQQRCALRQGTLILRIEDLDSQRCQTEYLRAIFEDLAWFGLRWDEGPDIGGPFAPYIQSQRTYVPALERLKEHGFVYPCCCSRQDVLNALGAPHLTDEEPPYPGTCRPEKGKPRVTLAGRINWRFRVPLGENIRFEDHACGPQSFIAGQDFGDFVVWRHDNVPSYQLATVVDDNAMAVKEVVRGADLLLSTARQLLLYRALEWTAPEFYHCPLLIDESGRRLAKRHDALSLRKLRENGASPESLRARWDSEFGITVIP